MRVSRSKPVIATLGALLTAAATLAPQASAAPRVAPATPRTGTLTTSHTNCVQTSKSDGKRVTVDVNMTVATLVKHRAYLGPSSGTISGVRTCKEDYATSIYKSWVQLVWKVYFKAPNTHPLDCSATVTLKDPSATCGIKFSGGSTNGVITLAVKFGARSVRDDGLTTQMGNQEVIMPKNYSVYLVHGYGRMTNQTSSSAQKIASDTNVLTWEP